MDTPFMDIVKSETLRGFTELTRFYMSDLDDSSSSFFFFTPFVQSSFFVLSSSHNALPNYSCVCSWLRVRQKRDAETRLDWLSMQ